MLIVTLMIGETIRTLIVFVANRVKVVQILNSLGVRLLVQCAASSHRTWSQG